MVTLTQGSEIEPQVPLELHSGCFFCGKALPEREMIVCWASSPDIWLHDQCAVELGMRLIDDGVRAKVDNENAQEPQRGQNNGDGGSDLWLWSPWPKDGFSGP